MKIFIAASEIFNIIALYKPPATCPKIFNSNFKEFLSTLNEKNIIFLGDVNLNILAEETNNMSEDGFISLINKPKQVFIIKILV